MLQRTKKLLEHNALLLACIATVVLAILSLSAIPKLNLGLNIKSGDKYLHILAYFVLSMVWYFALQKKLKNILFKFTLILSIVLYGIILETLQAGITTYRTADLFDAIANTIGVLLATAIFGRFIKWFNTI